MRQTGNDNLIWLWGPCLVNQSIKYDKYALELWISTELAIENQFYKTKMKIFKCIPSACESVYREIFIPQRETVRLLSKSCVSRVSWEVCFFSATRVKCSAIFYCPIKTTQPRPQGFSVADPFSGVYPVLLTSFSGHGKRVSNFVVASW